MAGKQLGKILNIECLHGDSKHSLTKMWGNTHETSLHAFANLGQSPSVWSGANTV